MKNSIIKISLLNIVLTFIGFLASAQNYSTLKGLKDLSNFEYSDFKRSNLSIQSKEKEVNDWWEPDTVYNFGNFIDNSRIILKYNSQGLLEKETGQNWVFNSWENSIQITNTYDTRSNLTSTLTQKWEKNSLINSNKTSYTHDSNNNILTRLSQGWYNNSWVNSDKTTCSYDSKNNKLTDLYERWENNILQIGYYDTCFYDSNNNLTSFIRKKYSFETNYEWRYIYRASYTYDYNNNLLSEFSEIADGVWKNAILVTNSYTDNKLTTKLWQRWENNRWENGDQEIYTYDSNNNIINVLLEIWNHNFWEKIFQYNFIYDSNNNMLIKLLQRRENDVWANVHQYKMTYNENMNGISSDYWEWIDESWQPSDYIAGDIMLVYYNNMQSSFFTWGYHKVTATYIKVSNISAIEKPCEKIDIYLNPTKDVLTIESEDFIIKQIDLFDISGRKILSHQINNSSSQYKINISQLPSEIYVMRITTDKCILTKKIVKM